jgi:hypothetical protein
MKVFYIAGLVSFIGLGVMILTGLTSIGDILGWKWERVDGVCDSDGIQKDLHRTVEGSSPQITLKAIHSGSKIFARFTSFTVNPSLNLPYRYIPCEFDRDGG